MCKGGGGGGDGGAAKREQERQQRISKGYRQIQSIFGGFDDAFYDDRAQSYTDYASPQLEDQYLKAQEALQFALARNGRLDSSTAAEQMADLEQKYGIQKTSIADRALGYANSARDAVNQSKSNLISINSNIADPSAITQQAQNAIVGLQAADTYEPLAPLFVNVGENLGTQAELERRSAAKYNSGLFTPSAVSKGQGSGRYIS